MSDEFTIPNAFTIPTFLSELRMTDAQEGAIRRRDYRKTAEQAIKDRHLLLNEVDMQRAQFQGLLGMLDGNNLKTIEIIKQRDRFSEALTANNICLECLGSGCARAGLGTAECPTCSGSGKFMTDTQGDRCGALSSPTPQE
jgi:hypothetical protein